MYSTSRSGTSLLIYKSASEQPSGHGGLIWICLTCFVPQVAFVMDKQTMEAFGFTMVPEASIKLAGAPECQSQDITITIQSSKKWMAEGLVEVTLPLLIKGGPVVLLTLRAVVVVPDLVPSTSVLDFGSVQTSHCKVKPLLRSGYGYKTAFCGDEIAWMLR